MIMEKAYTPFQDKLPESYDDEFPPLPGYLPVSAALIAVADPDSGVPNIMPLIAWSFINRYPLTLGISVCVKDYNFNYFVRGTYDLLIKTMDFTLNIPSEKLKDAITRSGELSRSKDPTCDKFKEIGLTPGKSRQIKSPHIMECPISYECVVRSIVHLGSHDLFLGHVVGCFTDGQVVDVQTLEGKDHITMMVPGEKPLTLEWSTLLKERS
jgi:flavin reductase (DIM6/NTAB) family NADH-FMN oxidoreductase RutF